MTHIYWPHIPCTSAILTGRSGLRLPAPLPRGLLSLGTSTNGAACTSTQSPKKLHPRIASLPPARSILGPYRLLTTIALARREGVARALDRPISSLSTRGRKAALEAAAKHSWHRNACERDTRSTVSSTYERAESLDCYDSALLDVEERFVWS